MTTDWLYPAIVAHRGGGNLAPENTLAAIRIGAKYGHKMIEVDVKLSADGEAFLLHDSELDRTTDSTGIAGAFSWSALTLLDAGSWFGQAFEHEPLPNLTQIAECCINLGLMINIEIKPTEGVETETGYAVATLANNLWRQQPVAPLLSSFSVDALEAAKRAAPDLPRGLLLEYWDEDWRLLTQDLACVSLHINHRELTEKRVAALKAAKLKILAYTVNGPERAKQLLSWGVDSICTDCIDIIVPDFAIENKLDR